MSTVRVSYDEIDRAASALAHGRDEIVARLRGMEGQIQQLVGSGFVTGHASTRFAAAFQEYTASASTIAEKLSEIGAFLTQTSAAYRELDAQVASRVR